jgi:GNAT superfamily N-acetyltransferase
MTECPECGFVYEDLPVGEVAARVESAPARYRQALLAARPDDVRRRPAPEVWSALEYVEHVRDVLLIQRDRAVVTLIEDRPKLFRMYRDERVTLCHYDRVTAEDAVDQLAMAAQLCALLFAGITGDAWSRTLVYNWPEVAVRDLAWLGRQVVHEVEHHLADVISVLSQAAGWSALAGWASADGVVPSIHPVGPADRVWMEQEVTRRWGASIIVSRGVAHDVGVLPALMAELNGDRVGLVTYRIDGDEAELVSLDALERGQGVGSLLLDAVIRRATEEGCRRLWLVTSNDNLDALRFYQRRRMRIVAVHRGGVDDARRIKPSIPLLGEYGIATRDELELELIL